MWGACVGVYQLLNWKMHGETLKNWLLIFKPDTFNCYHNTHGLQAYVNTNKQQNLFNLGTKYQAMDHSYETSRIQYNDCK